jgi:hypothetical protein
MTKAFDVGIKNFKMHDLTYHRNGITGKGFYACSFSADVDGRFEQGIATVDADDIDVSVGEKFINPGTRVLMVGNGGGIDVTRTMRGDHFHPWLREAIEEHNTKERRDSDAKYKKLMEKKK